MYRSVRINKHTYAIIEEMARSSKRTIVGMIDYIVENEMERQNGVRYKVSKMISN